MGDTSSARRAGGARRAFLSTSAVAAAGIPLVAGAGPAAAGPLPGREPDAGPREMLRHVDAGRIEATVRQLVAFGTRHTASSQDDPARGIGAAPSWVYARMQEIAATSNSAMTVQKQTFVQPEAV